MRELAVLIFQTLNGVMQAPKLPEEDQSNGFSGGGWADPYWDDVMPHVGLTAMAEPYDLLLGRKTYETFAGAHSASQTVESATPEDRLTLAKKYVVTSSSDPLSWNNSERISGDIPANIRALKSQSGVLLQVHGSWQLIQLLLAHDLIDEFRLWTFPVIVGDGKRLFGDGAPPANLKLVKLEPSSPDGPFLSVYRRT